MHWHSPLAPPIPKAIQVTDFATYLSLLGAISIMHFNYLIQTNTKETTCDMIDLTWRSRFAAPLALDRDKCA